MKEILLIVHTIIAVSLIIIILMQSSGSGVGIAFGGSEGYYRSKRGIEKLFVILTVVLASLFFIISIIQILV